MSGADDNVGAAPSINNRWKELEQELTWFGTRLEDLRSQSELVGPATIDDLQQRYDDMTQQVCELRNATEEELDQREGDALSVSKAKDAAKTIIGEVGVGIADNVQRPANDWRKNERVG